MEVMVGSSFGIGVSAYVRERDGVSAQDKALFLADESKRGGGSRRIGLSLSCESPEESSEDSSSSIGESNDDDDVSDQGGFDSFSSSLEDSLPNKRGLSNHYVGKSKSFGNLMEAKNFDAKDLEKTENPLNKKRRLIIANKMKLRGKRSFSASNFYTWQNPNSLPLLALQESNRDRKEEEGDGDDNDDQTTMMMKNKRDLIVQTHSCFCLSSLQEEEDDDDDDDDDE
ncbi:unnamed protein product [Cochlearia groenlandica]